MLTSGQQAVQSPSPQSTAGSSTPPPPPSTPVTETIQPSSHPAIQLTLNEPSAVYEKSPLLPPPAEEKKGLSSLRKTSTIVAGGSSLKLSDLDAEVDASHAKDTAAPAAPLTLERLQAAWNAYGDSIDKDSVRMVLKNTELQLEGDSLVALVGTALAENTLRQENRLMEFVRKQAAAPRLSLDIRMDASKTPAYTPPPRPLTNSEKFWRLKQDFPQVEELRKRFDLQFEE